LEASHHLRVDHCKEARPLVEEEEVVQKVGLLNLD
jgi:hypothetical protein